MPTRLDPPKETKGDAAHALAKGGIGSIPMVGGVGAEVFNLLLSPPMGKRLHKWRENIGERLKALEDAGYVTLSDLQDNEDFISVVAKASQYAVTTNDEAKLDALRNAVINSALGIEPDESLRQMFLRFVDELTGWHVRVLRLLQDAEGWYRQQGRQAPQYVLVSSLSNMITDAYPELKGRRDLLELIHSDLVARALTSSGNFHVMMSGGGAYQKRTTDFGERFLRLITDKRE